MDARVAVRVTDAADGPWALPEGWAWARLADLGRWSGGGTPSKAIPDFWMNGTVPWVSPKDMKVDVITDSEDQITPEAVAGSATKYVPAGSVLMVMRSGILRHSFPVAVSGRVVTLNQDLRALTPFESVSAAFLARYLKFAARQVLHDCSKDGTTVNSIDADALERVRVPIAPLAEQRRIVARIDGLFAEIANGEAALRAARDGFDTFRRALLKAAVTGELTKGWRETNRPAESGHELLVKLRRDHPDIGSTRRGWRPSAQPLPQLPSGWAWSAVEEAGEVQLGRQRAPQHHAGSHMRPYLRVANVLERRLDLSDVKEMNFTPQEFETFALRPGDVLLNEGQAPDQLGRPAIYGGEIAECCFQKTLLRFRAKAGIVPEYALAVFRHYMRSGRFKRESRITTNIGHLTQARFVVMEFPLPPTDEQREIVHRLTALEGTAEEGVETAFREDTNRLRQSVLKAAFEGHLAPQDPADEPASAMLARTAVSRPVALRSVRGHRKRT